MSEVTRKRLRRGRLAIVLITAAVALLIITRTGVGLYVDSLWYRELGYSSVFWKDLTWVWGARSAMALLVGGALFLNLRVVAASLGTLQIRRRFGNLEIAERLPKHYITGGVLVLSGLLGLWFGASVPEGVARSLLLWSSAPEWGMTDPFLGRDLGFYVFLVPILRAGVSFGLVVGFLVLAVTVAGYATTGTFQVGQGGIVITERARRHLGVLLALFLLLLAARFALGRSLLLFYGTSDIPGGLFGYTDYTARFPALRVLTVATVLGAVGVLVGAWRNQVVPVFAGLAALLVGGLVGGQLYPYLVQRFAVVPNELGRETPYIEENLRFTREGFGLSALLRDDFPAVLGGDVDWDLALERFQGLPVWGSDALLTTFRQRQARFRYYDFSTPEIDRYDSDEGPVPVALAVREVEAAGIDDPNWQNLHLRERFVVGNGVVATAAAGRTDEWGPGPFLSGLPLERSPGAPEGLRLRHASIFFPSESQAYAVLNPTDSSFLAPGGGPGVSGEDYPEGISLGGALRKLALAWHLQEANLLFAGEVNPDSRLVLHRGVRERVQRIAPFLRFPESPYPVIHEGRVLWVMEGFTATRYFPVARPFELEFRRPVAYVRNSVKITVDAVTGAVDFYGRPDDDPLLAGWRAAYPGLFKPLEEMPESLRHHLRYPRALLDVQSRVLQQYHQESPSVFFLQEEAWSLTQELSQSTSSVEYLPEYAILQLPGDTVPHFQVNTVFVPAGRQNLTGLLSGRVDPDGQEVLRLLDFPISQELPGPRQVEAFIEQSPEISEQFSLWRQGGSRVWTGHLHVVPLGESILYMEPIFLAAEDNAIPELRRFVVSDGQRVAMEETLAGAVAALASGSVGGATPEPGSQEPRPISSSSAGAAMGILEEAEARLREGDFAGFGEALERLRRALEAMDSTAVPGG